MGRYENGAHGRYALDAAKAGDWSVGDKIQFVDCQYSNSGFGSGYYDDLDSDYMNEFGTADLEEINEPLADAFDVSATTESTTDIYLPFGLTSLVNFSDDHELACRNEFGQNAVVADKPTDFELLIDNGLLDTLIAELGLASDMGYFVTGDDKKWCWFPIEDTASSGGCHKNGYNKNNKGKVICKVSKWWTPVTLSDGTFKYEYFDCDDIDVVNSGVPYKLTSSLVKFADDHRLACQNEFGSDASVADVKTDLDPLQYILDVADAVGMVFETTYFIRSNDTTYYLVGYNGNLDSKLWSRFSKVEYDKMSDQNITSWFDGTQGQVLCYLSNYEAYNEVCGSFSSSSMDDVDDSPTPPPTNGVYAAMPAFLCKLLSFCLFLFFL